MPDIPETAYVHPRASRLGDVAIGEYASLWPSCSIRGDFSPIRIGAGSSIQDCCVLHSTPTDGVHVGSFVTVGHGAVLHGCTIEDNCLIGMNATVLDKARIGRGSIVAAGAVVREGQEVPPGSFAAGVPAEVKPGREGQEQEIREGALIYIALSRQYKAGKQTIDPQRLAAEKRAVEAEIASRCGLKQPAAQPETPAGRTGKKGGGVS